MPARSPFTSLVASAKRITSKTLKDRSFRTSPVMSWQEDAWEMYDLVGEQRFLATTLANRLSQAIFYVGTLNDNPNLEPVPVETGLPVDLLEAVGGGVSGLRQIVNRLGINLFVSGEAWLVGMPPAMADNPKDWGDDELDLSDLDWRVLSISEVTTTRDGSVTLRLDQEEAVAGLADRLDVDPAVAQQRGPADLHVLVVVPVPDDPQGVDVVEGHLEVAGDLVEAAAHGSETSPKGSASPRIASRIAAMSTSIRRSASTTGTPRDPRTAPWIARARPWQRSSPRRSTP